MNSNQTLLWLLQDSALGLWALTMHTTACAPLVMNHHTMNDLLFEANVDASRRGEQLQRAWDAYARANPYDPNVVVTECVADTMRSRRHPFIHTSIGLFSAMLPADLCYSGAGIRIVNGILVDGAAHADVWSKHLFPFVFRVCGADAAVALLDRVERLGALVAERIGTSINCFSNPAMLEEARTTIEHHLSEIKKTATKQCSTLHECETRNYILHHKLLGVQNAAQKVTERHIVAPLGSLSAADARRWVKRALLVVGAPPDLMDDRLPAEARYDYAWVKTQVPWLVELYGHCDDDMMKRVLTALYQPRWTAARAANAPEWFVVGPCPNLELHSCDAEMRTHSFMSDVDPTTAYCVGSRSVSIGTVSQMMCAVGQLFSDNGDVHNRQGPQRVEFVDDAPDDHIRAITTHHAAHSIDWTTLSDTIGTESSGMILRSFTQGLTARSMHIMGTTVRSTMANSGNGTRRAGHLARLTSIYGENFSVNVCFRFVVFRATQMKEKKTSFSGTVPSETTAGCCARGSA